MAQFQFDATVVQPDSGVMGAVPAGWYNVSVDETSIESTSSGTGAYIKARFNIIDGDFSGQKFWNMFNVQNENEKTVEIGLAQLSALCHAVGVLNFQNTEQLHGIPLKVRVKVEKGDGQYPDQNRITAYRDIAFEGADPTPTKAGNATTAKAPTAGAIPNFSASASAPTQPQAQPQSPAMAQQPWEQPQAQTAPASAPAPAPAPAPASAPVLEYVMTAQANGLTREDYHKAKWTDEQLVEHGFMTIVEKQAPAPAPAPTQAPVAPSAPAPASAPTAQAPGAGASLPPWMAQQ